MIGVKLSRKLKKGSCVVVWGREGYILGAEIQLRNVTVVKDVVFQEKNVATSYRK